MSGRDRGQGPLRPLIAKEADADVRSTGTVPKARARVYGGVSSTWHSGIVVKSDARGYTFQSPNIVAFSGTAPCSQGEATVGIVRDAAAADWGVLSMEKL